MTIDVPVLVALIGGLAAVVGTLGGAILARMSHRETGLATQLTDVRRRLEKSEARERVRDDYINVLRRKMAQAGLDVPEYPEELTHVSD